MSTFMVTASEMKAIVRALYGHEKANGTSLALWGPPGIGKTQLFEQVGAEVGAEVKVFLTATMDPTDVVGVPHPDGNITRFLPPEAFYTLTETYEEDIRSLKGDKTFKAPPVIALFDDMPACNEQVFAALFRLFQQREVGGHRIRDNVLLVATGNRVEDKAGASDIPTALANRFVHFNLAVNADEWRTWAFQNDIDENVISFVRANGSYLHNFDPNSGFMAFPTPRSVAKASDLVQAIGIDNKAALRVALIGCCGEGWGTEFMAFLKVRNKLIPPEQIVKNPEGCKVPAEGDIDVMFSTITSLTYYVKKTHKPENATACLRYAVRMPSKEMGICLARDILLGVVMASDDAAFRAKVLGSKEFQEMMPNYRKYLKVTD